MRSKPFVVAPPRTRKRQGISAAPRESVPSGTRPTGHRAMQVNTMAGIPPASIPPPGPQRRQSPITAEPPCSSKRKDRRSPKPRRSPTPFPVQLRFRIDRKQRAYCTRFGVTSAGIPPASIPPPGPQRRQSPIITGLPCSSKRKDRRSPKPRRSPNPFPAQLRFRIDRKQRSLPHQVRRHHGRNSARFHPTARPPAATIAHHCRVSLLFQTKRPPQPKTTAVSNSVSGWIESSELTAPDSVSARQGFRLPASHAPLPRRPVSLTRSGHRPGRRPRPDTRRAPASPSASCS